LPFADQTFDGVVSTFTLCTIPDVHSALREARRVVKGDGMVAFLEHGLSEDPGVATRQRLLNPVQKVVACGCHLNRPIDRLITGAGFSIETLERYEMPGLPRHIGTIYRGLARRAWVQESAQIPAEEG
jgi:SAM-dependent methyltransferase